MFVFNIRDGESKKNIEFIVPTIRRISYKKKTISYRIEKLSTTVGCAGIEVVMLLSAVFSIDVVVSVFLLLKLKNRFFLLKIRLLLLPISRRFSVVLSQRDTEFQKTLIVY